MKRYHLDVLGISESHWTDSSRQVLRDGSVVILRSGHENTHTHGVAILISKEKATALLVQTPEMAGTCVEDRAGITEVALRWTPPGKRTPGRPKTTWRRTGTQELKQINLLWGEAQHAARDRMQWRVLISHVPTRTFSVPGFFFWATPTH